MKKLTGLILLLLSISICFTACNPTDSDDGNADTPSCADLVKSMSSVPQDDIDDPVYRVVAPNGGESFKVGETMKIVVTSKQQGSAYMQLSFIKDGVERSFRVPGTPDYGFDPQQECTFTFVIPESLTDFSGENATFSTISDSVKILIKDYMAAEYSDRSDSFFSIKAQ